MALVRLFALVLGVFYLIIGILGFLRPFVSTAEVGPLVLGAGDLFGIFAVNWLHNLVHILVGLFGIWAGAFVDSARLFARVIGWVFLVLFVIGVLTPSPLFLDVLPLNAADDALDLVTAVLGLFFGYAPLRVVAQPTALGAPERHTHI